ncbi:BMP family ABC transporter substrate-binding protein [Deltaproteobacteria bacterium Smac51]|nr:BMP family ABC transporter substrate-binding protein [Deltaproteobacteria bacterium Smac51]
MHEPAGLIAIYSSKAMFPMKPKALIFCLCLLILMLCGCEDRVDLKAPTVQTPQSRTEVRHALDPADVVTGIDRPVSKTPVSDLKVGFILLGKVGDYGFSYSQNQGRLALSDEFGLDTIVIENVPEDETCLKSIQILIDNGCRIIFTSSFGFSKYAALMADKYPDVYFFNCAGNDLRPNLSQYFGRIYQARYLTGIVAGLRTQTGRIGYVAAIPIPEVVRGVDAFALGVKFVNPEARIHLQWTGTWYDPALERDLTLGLIDQGCDVIAQHQDSVAPQVAAEERGVWSIGYHSSMEFFAPNAYLTGASWDWAPYMIDQIRKIDSGTWESSSYWGGMFDGTVRLDRLTDKVAPGTRQVVNEETLAIKSGFEVFTGPIYDNEGLLRVKPGYTLTDEEKLSLDWLVDNIIGEIRQ